MKFVQARHYKPVSGRQIDVVVLHSMEAPEKGTTAEAVAEYFRTTTRPASCHYCIDNNSVVQCVRVEHVAYAAPGANHNGIQLEHAGYARQSRDQWLDLYSEEMLRRSAVLAAGLATQFDIPVMWLTPAQLKAGKRGFTSHANVSEAFRRSDHWDPGPHFPIHEYLEWVRDAQDPLRPLPVRVFVNGKPIPAAAYFDRRENRNYVHAKPLLEALGGELVAWSQQDGKATLDLALGGRVFVGEGRFERGRCMLRAADLFALDPKISLAFDEEARTLRVMR